MKKYTNNTKKPITLREEHGIGELTIPPNGGVGEVFTGAQNRSRQAFASRVTLEWYFIKTMEKEQEVMELLKNDLKTYYALNILKHFLLKDRNILVKTTIEGGKEKTEKYTAEDLGLALGKSRQTGSTHIKRLKKLNIVKSIKTEDFGCVFAINPDYYMNGTYVPKEIYDLFTEKRNEKR